MSNQGIKRRPSTSTSHPQLKRRRSSASSRAGSPNKRNRALPAVRQERGFFGNLTDYITSLLAPNPAPMPSPSRNELQSSSSSSLESSPSLTTLSPLESYPGGSLAMLQDADTRRRSRSSPLAIADGQPGSSSAPIELTEEDDADDTPSVDDERPSPSAGPSRQCSSPLLGAGQQLLFPESFSQPRPAHGLPTPPDSQEPVKPPTSKRVHRNQPSRPDVRVTPPPRKKLGWEQRSISPTSSVSSRASTLIARPKKHRSNMRSPEQIHRSRMRHVLDNLQKAGLQEGNQKISNAALRVKKLFTGRGAEERTGHAAEFAQSALTNAGLSSKELYAKLLGSRPTITVEEKTAPQRPSLFQVAHKQKIGVTAKEIASRPSAFNLSELGKSIVEEQERLDREIAEKLKPKVPKLPTKLAPEQEAAVNKNLSNPAFSITLTSAEVKAGSLRRLRPDTWLDDEVMNAYCAMMAERAKNTEGGKKVHWLNSFFYQRLSENGYQAVRRWNKKIDIFSQDVMVFPVNMGNMHWTACAINFEKKRIEYYDSMGDGAGHRRQVFRLIRDYLRSEHKEKKKSDIDLSGWTDEFNNKTPQQDNGSDCGVFSSQTLEMITRGRDLVDQGFEFTARNMPFFRRLMVWEIGRGRLEVRKWGAPKL